MKNLITFAFVLSMLNAWSQNNNIFEGSTGDGYASAISSFFSSTEESLSVTITDSTNVACFGDNSGSTTATATGGTPPYTYFWSIFATDSVTISALAANIYYVTVTDNAGNTAVDSVEITEPAPISISTSTTPPALYQFDGQINLTVTGGTSPYTFFWSNGATTEDVTNIGVVSNGVTITDANGCILDTIIKVNANLVAFNGDTLFVHPTDNSSGIKWGEYVITTNATSLTDGFNNTATIVSILGDNGGTVYAAKLCDTLNAYGYSNWYLTAKDELNSLYIDKDFVGGFANNYYWSSSEYNADYAWGQNFTNGDQINLSKYGNVLVRCIRSSQQLNNLAILISTSDAACNGTAGGSASVTTSEGTPPYSYNWSTGGTDSSISTLAANIYYVTVTDNAGNTAVDSVEITEPTPIYSTAVITNSTCTQLTGAIDVTASGGMPPHSYQWDNSVTTEDLSGYGAGVYMVQVTDNAGCYVTDTYVITNTNGPQSDTMVVSPVNCYGLSTGAINMQISGGTSPYTYLWSNYSTTANISSVPAGVYNVEITDATGCPLFLQGTITQKDQVIIDFSVTEAACGDSTGSVAAQVSGGVPPYNFAWSNGDSTQVISDLYTSVYILTLTDDIGCITTDYAIVETQTYPSATYVVSNPSCGNLSDGEISITASGGSPPYTYGWSTGDSTSTASGLPAGFYVCGIIDIAGCMNILDFFLEAPPVITISLDKLNNLCQGYANGNIDIHAQGGIAPYSYAWTYGETTEDIEATVGDYSITVTDSTGCSAIDTFSVHEIVVDFGFDTKIGCTPLTVSLTNQSDTSYSYAYYLNNTGPYYIDSVVTQHTITSNGINEFFLFAYDVYGMACYHNDTVIVNGAPETFLLTDNTPCVGDDLIFYEYTGIGSDYLWDFGDGTQVDGQSVAIHAYADTGAYTANLIITTVCGIDTISHGVNVGNSFPADGYFTSAGQICPGDILEFWATGSGSFDWNFGDGSFVNSTVPFVSYFYQDTGQYVVSLAVTNGCGMSANYSDTIIVGSNVPLYGNFNLIATPDTICQGGYANIKFQDNNSASVYIVDYGDGQIDTTSNEIIHTYASDGNYEVFVTSIDGCSNSRVDSTIVIVAQNGPNNASDYDYGVITTTLCPGDSVAFFAEAGASSYYWDFGDGNSETSPYLFNNDVIAMHAYSDTGTYTVTYTQHNGCGNSFTDTFQISVGTNYYPNSTTFGTGIIWNGIGNAFSPTCREIYFTPLTGSSFIWNFGDGDTLATDDLSVPHTFTTPGIYNITLESFNSCGNSATFSSQVLIQGACEQVFAELTVTDPTCFGGYDGTASVSAFGGTPPYSYIWNSVGGTTDSSITGLASGTYTVTVLDANSDSIVVFAVINNPEKITYSISVENVLCNGDSSGAVNLSLITQGVYGFQWSNNSTSEDISNLSASTYYLAIQDSNGCSEDDSVVILEPQPFSLITSPTNITCAWLSDGAIDLSVSGATPPYSFLWSEGSTTEDISDVLAAEFTVIVTDSVGCQAFVTIVLTEPEELVVLNNVTNESYAGAYNGSIDLSVTGGTFPYSYNWSNGKTTQDINGLGSGTYTVIVKDVRNCFAMDTAVMQLNCNLSITVNIGDATCGHADGVATVTVSGGSDQYTYIWSSGETSNSVDSLAASLYMVTVTDIVSSCSKFGVISVNDGAAAQVSVSSVTNVSCYNGTNGAIDINVSGGEAPYSYNWANGASTEDINNLSTGPYEIIVEDNAGCISVFGITVNQPDEMIISSEITMASCGNSDGSATIAVSGGTSPYFYTWSTTGTDVSEDSLAAGVYTVFVLDNKYCTGLASVAISEEGAATVVVDSVVDQSCGGNDGAVYITTFGGNGPLDYLWSNDEITEDIMSLMAGNYDIVITDTSGCMAFISVEVDKTVPDPPAICMVTVDTISGKNLIVWEKIETQEIESYNIYKETTQSNVYQLIGNVPYNEPSVFLDTVSNPVIRSWRYKIALIDTCGNVSLKGEEHKTIHLNANLSQSGWNNLDWDHYQGFSFSSYVIFRFAASAGWQQLATIPSTLNYFTDDAPPAGIVYYQVVAMKGDTCHANEAKVQQGPYSQSFSNLDDNGFIDDGVEEYSSFEYVHIFPNPSSGMFTIELQSIRTMDNIILKLIDATGCLIEDRSIDINSNYLATKMDLGNYSNGMYYLQLINESEVFTKKLILSNR